MLQVHSRVLDPIFLIWNGMPSSTEQAKVCATFALKRFTILGQRNYSTFRVGHLIFRSLSIISSEDTYKYPGEEAQLETQASRARQLRLMDTKTFCHLARPGGGRQS